jgi:hypothetical protein
MIRAALTDLGKGRERHNPDLQRQDIPTAKRPRSSNLKLPRQFTDRDRDKFLRDTFSYISEFFRESLQELEKRNPGIEIEFQEVDARSFEATAYVGGTRKTHCGVWWGDKLLGRGILYSSSGVTRNSFNESISVEHDSDALFLKPLGMPHLMGGVEQKLSQHGAAEYLWSLFIERVR